MRRIYFLLFFILGAFSARSQHIICPDTACVGEPVSFSVDSALNFTTYAWQFGSSTMTPILSASVPIPNTGTNGNRFSLSSAACMVYDTSNKVFHAFVTSATSAFNAPNVQRIDFGPDPNNPSPATVDLGNPNNAFVPNSVNGGSNNMEDLKVVLNDDGIFHAFINNGGIVHWVFGNGLANPPTQAKRIFTDKSVINMSMNMAIIKYKNEWHLFNGQTGGPGIVRFDLGPDLNNIPANIPYVALPLPSPAVYNLCYFAVIKESGRWYINVGSLVGNSPLVKYDFGPDLLNPNPAVTNLGNFNPPINLPRGMNFIKSCDTFFMLSLNQDGTVLAFDYKNDLSNKPVTQSLGKIYGSSVSMQIFYPYWYHDTLWALSASWMNNPNYTIYRFPIVSIPSGNAEIKYYDPATTHIFTNPGVYDVTLYCDQGDNRGPQAYCTQIVVLPGVSDILGPDTGMCEGKIFTLDASGSGASGYTWSDGSSGSTLTIDRPGKYWVTLDGLLCSSSDTIRIDEHPIPDVDLGADTTICNGKVITLKSSVNYTNPAYHWNNNVSAATLNVNNAGNYILSVTENGCTGSDTVAVAVHTTAVDLGGDAFICSGYATTLSSALNYADPDYKWSTGDTTSSLTVSQAGTYSLSVTDAGCTGSDTVTVAVKSVTVELGPDTAVCDHQPVTLHSSVAYDNPVYSWSTGAATPALTVTESGLYTLTVTDGGCSGTDSIRVGISTLPDTVSIGNDQTLCNRESATLNVMPQQAGWSYLWSTGNTSPSIEVVSSGIYSVRVTDEYGCIAGDTVKIKAIDISQHLGYDLSFCKEDPIDVTLKSNIPEGAAVLWSTGAQTPVLEVRDSGTYWVKVSLAPCGTSSDTISINTHQCSCDVYVPNAFTPNGDGRNDMFRPVLDPNCSVLNYQFTVFNRWGQQVFYSTKPGKGWDGMINGKKAELGVYMYVATYTLELTAEQKVLKGDVLLMK